MNRQDIELYVTGNYDGDVAALERAIAEDPALAAIVADEASLELLLRDAAATATFCAACSDLVRGQRCDSCGAAVRPGGYVVERVLVSNAHGRMYVAHDADGTQVALKELAFVHAPSAAAIAAFEHEARFLRALEHPAIPRFVASWQEGHGVHTRYYLAQELVAGEPLDRLDDHWYREDEIVALARRVLEILVYLQSLSPMVIHRDIKPANLLKRADGTIALVDFGAAYVQGSTAGSTTVGTFGYMPIEQLAGQVDATTDGFALGATLLHLLTRQEPWKLAHAEVTINVSAPVRAFLDKLVAPDPRARFASANAALTALDRRDELAVPPRKRSRRAPRYAIAAALAVGSGGGLFAYLHEPSKSVASRPAVGYATLEVEMPGFIERDLEVDGRQIASVKSGFRLPLLSGVHEVSVIGAGGERCHQQLLLETGKTTKLDCSLWMTSAQHDDDEDSLSEGPNVDLSFKGASLHDVMRILAAQCKLNVVVPDTVDQRIDVQLTNVPCDQAITVLLASHELSYRYQSQANLMRVAPRKGLDAEAEAANARARVRGDHWIADDVLPAGHRIDVDQLRGTLADTIDQIAKRSGVPINVIIPETVGGNVTVVAKGVPWQTALQYVLASQGLWYRYHDRGHFLQIGPRKQLDAEDEATATRGVHP